MANFITTTIGQSLVGTSGGDNMTFGIQSIDGVAFVATGSLSGAGGDDFFFTLNAPAIGPGGPLFNGVQYAYGNGGNDTITLGGLFTAYGGKGNDFIAEDTTAGVAASQQFFGGEGSDTISAGGGNDYIEGNQGIDLIDAGTGNDLVWGGKDNDLIEGNLGLDTIYGNLGNDLINGGLFITPAGVVDAADSINGGQGNDTIFGNTGNDTIFGGEGGDSIIGNAGNDILTGGAGGDVFRYQGGFAQNVGAANVDILTDFVSGTDDLSFATGADQFIQGRNFTAATLYAVNTGFGPATINLTGFGNNNDYEGVFTTLATAFGATLTASTNATLQVLNLLVQYQGTNTNFVLFNNGDTVVSQNDVLMQGFHVAPVGDIAFSA